MARRDEKDGKLVTVAIDNWWLMAPTSAFVSNTCQDAVNYWSELIFSLAVTELYVYIHIITIVTTVQ